MTRTEIIGDATLYLGDCREILPTLCKVDAVVTDPPYGINYGALLKGKGDGLGGADKNGWRDYGAPMWDAERPCRDIFDLMRKQSGNQIIWGGNYFTDYLPPSMQWLIWDKGQREFSLADFEMAWSSQNRAARIINFPRAKALQDGKEHPTQKPIEVMRWCISQLPKAVRTILDPFMGSGTTGVAATDLGKQFSGIERDLKYFDIACRRIEEAYKQPRLFKDEAPKAVQEQLL